MKFLSTVVQANGLVTLDVYHRNNFGHGMPSGMLCYVEDNDECVLEMLRLLTELAAPIRRARKRMVKTSGNVIAGHFGDRRERADG